MGLDTALPTLAGPPGCPAGGTAGAGTLSSLGSNREALDCPSSLAEVATTQAALSGGAVNYRVVLEPSH